MKSASEGALRRQFKVTNSKLGERSSLMEVGCVITESPFGALSSGIRCLWWGFFLLDRVQ